MKRMSLHADRRGQATSGKRRVWMSDAGRPGVAFVEFSLIAPLLLLMLFAVIEFALAIHTEVDYSDAVTNASRQVSINGANTANDDTIGQIMFQTMRQDNPNRANYYYVRLVGGRAYNPTPDGAGGPLYVSIDAYAYDHTLKQFDPMPFDTSVGGDSFSTSFGVVDPCAYYYQVHTNNLNSNVYFDADETTLVSSLDALHFPRAALSGGCSRSTHSASALTCGAGETGYAGGATMPAFLENQLQDQLVQEQGAISLSHGVKMCYYYPSQRVASIDRSAGDNENALPDLVEVGVNYTYKPLGDYVTAHSPLGLGFTITERASDRLEPSTENQ